MAAPGTHLDFQLQRYVIAEAQVPVVMCSSEVRGRVVLRDAEMPDAIGDAVLDARSFVGTTVVEIGIEQMARAAANVEFARARLQRDVHGLGALPVHSAGLVLQIARIAAVPRKRAAMPEKNDEHENESQCPKCRAEGNSRARAIGILPPLRGIPHLAQPNE